MTATTASAVPTRTERIHRPAWNPTERTTGTLERLMTMPLAKLGLLLGYGIAIAALATIQALMSPQLILCGLFVARDQVAQILQILSGALPLSYAFGALQRATVRGTLGARGSLDVIVILGATLLALALGAATLRRRTA